MFTANSVRDNPKSIDDLVKEIPKLEEFPKYLWHCNYYDGPLSGVCIHNGKEHWFECAYETDWVGEDEDGEPDYIQGRLFGVVELTDEEIKYEWDSHTVFAKHYRQPVVCYGEKNKRVYPKRTLWDNLRDRIERFIWRSKAYLRVSKRYDEELKEKGLDKSKHQEYRDRPFVAWYAERSFSFDLCLTEGLKKAGKL